MQELGHLNKMKAEWVSDRDPVQYAFRLNDKEIPMNDFVGKSLTLKHTGQKNCVSCGRSIPKTFQQGYCFPCTQKLAETDICIVKPELCHFHKGTCRDEEFAKKHCFITHSIYLAVSSHAKVGITRSHQVKTRWADQGASYAMEVLHVPDRKTAGEIEDAMKPFISDKTNWRKMLQGEVDEVDLYDLKGMMLSELPEEWQEYAVESDLVEFNYPVNRYPEKIKSYNLDKTPEFSDTLWGIKGQYLIFENGVINIRKYQGYEISFQV